MMDTAVIVALITAGLGFAGTLVTVAYGNRKQRDDTSSQMAAQQQDIASKMAAQQQDIAGQLAEQSAEIMRQLDKHNAVQDERIRQLTERVERHNNVVERTYVLEGRVTGMSKRITDIAARLNATDDT